MLSFLYTKKRKAMTDKEPQSKKPYSTPEVKAHGKIAKIIAGGSLLPPPIGT